MISRAELLRQQGAARTKPAAIFFWMVIDLPLV
jgi:hypothetical protein